jgi:hypothetical protein
VTFNIIQISSPKHCNVNLVKHILLQVLVAQRLNYAGKGEGGIKSYLLKPKEEMQS